MNDGNKIIYDKIRTLSEVLATFSESGVDSMNDLVSLLDLKDLDGDERTALKGWHEGAKQSAKSIREPN